MDIEIGDLVVTTVHSIQGIGIVLQIKKPPRTYEVFWLDNKFFGTIDFVDSSEITNVW